ncbi:hypothetical protein [Paenibacillus cremeus]|uniref:hypothetical protein n=1 Tax=Paenibacillus cremeus TaxID=2163881 RepID=UPI001648047B|nr:hypothetical protein [Paenibacillus cremeus]
MLQSLLQLAERVDVVVLAQASMSRVLTRLEPNERERFLTSPRLAMVEVAQLFTREA